MEKLRFKPRVTPCLSNPTLLFPQLAMSIRNNTGASIKIKPRHLSSKQRESLHPKVYTIDSMSDSRSVTPELSTVRLLMKRVPQPKAKQMWLGLDLQVPPSQSHLVVAKCPTHELEMPIRSRSSFRHYDSKGETMEPPEVTKFINSSFSPLRGVKKLKKSALESSHVSSQILGISVCVTRRRSTSRLRTKRQDMPLS